MHQEYVLRFVASTASTIFLNSIEIRTFPKIAQLYCINSVGFIAKSQYGVTKIFIDRYLHIHIGFGRFLPDSSTETDISSREFIKKAEFVNAETFAGTMDDENPSSGSGSSGNQSGGGNTGGNTGGGNAGGGGGNDEPNGD